ncbi:adenylate/guanylate cyclase domain-containing protein [Bradyrhizobium sp. AUGA SZCCT0177]|nr:adenylate/guanylate cyclase domain-containing protein [Bradyrhizobium sp. AUGA SZCCT0177]MBR1286830.1 adenylate/guanylate cyclase domain-containing protein [Bradyrhizobium sp. AUGA SZCCT0177]
MPEDRVDRRLAAILAIDVAGYSRLMGVDEEGTLAALKAHRSELIDPKVAEHRGRIVKTTGDGALVEFSSAVDGVRCAMQIQRVMAERNTAIPEDHRIKFRIGINVGDIIIDEGDIYGDGVNVAARVEAECEPGGVYLSGNAFEQIRSKTSFTFDDMGERHLENIERPVRVYSARAGEPKVAARSNIQATISSVLDTGKSPLSLPDKPSIAVLPFENMSGDPEQEYFADGMVEDITTALSRFKALFVIARNSSFTYKGTAVDIKQVGRELGVRYVLEGSVRKAANRVRITGQLVDAMTGAHLWADRFDGGLDDIFELQDQVTVSVVGAIAPTLEQAEIERSKRKPTENLDAYDYYLRGVASAIPYTREGDNEALRLFYRAIELDPDFAVCYGWAAWIFVTRKSNGWMADRALETAEATRLCRRAVELGDHDAAALCWGGFALAYIAHELDDGIAYLDRALVLNSNLAAAWYVSGWLKVYSGEPEDAIEHAARAMRLSPLDPLIFRMHCGIAYAHFFAGHYDDASSWAEKAVRARPTWLTAVRGAAASHALAGRLDEARKHMARMRELDPALCISNLKDLLPLRREEDFAKWVEALRKAGLPE